MKSRIRPNSLPLDTKQLPVIHSARSGVAVNKSARFSRRFNSRRQGQALLLAVLIMLLAALLSAGFLAVVSGNLNQTARIADKTKAIEASRAGIVFANEQLSGSSQGDLWRPVDVSPAPPPGATGYDFYYSQLDKAQGWANQLPVTAPGYRDTAFAKFPAPDQPSSDAPKFLVKVQELTTNPGDPAYDANHAGELKITSIGLSDDDPNVFHTSIAYKDGRRKSPWASALRSISNWNFGVTDKTTGVPYATKPRIVNAATTFPANQVEFAVDATDKPIFSDDDVPFNVVIVKKDAAPTVRGAVVTKVSANGKQLTFARLEQTIGADETIQKAASLGIGSTIDLLNTGTAAAYPTDLPQPNGIMANGSVWLQGQIQLSNLSKNGTKLTTSGSLAIDATDADKKPVLQNSGDIGPTNTTDSTSNKIVPSSQTNFPGNLVLTSAAASDGVKKTDLINDGWDKIDAQTLGLDYSGARDVQPFTPVKLDSAENLARYRALTRNSADGVYIDNRDDIERVGTAPMTQTQLIEMLTSPATAATPPDTARLGVAALPTATNVSLEQRHLRGWVGPDEFLARGALVELVQATGANPQIRVTLDARSDANPDGPDANKTFRGDDGKLQTGVYSRIFDWPKNGTLLAEGNLRIRGNVNLSNLKAGANAADFPSLTVVSMNNIYIEGALSLDSKNAAGNPIPILARKKLMLLARKNVIVNPTRAVIGRTDAQTIAANDTAAVVFTGTATAKTLRVANNLLFNAGDYVTIGIGQNKSLHGLITEVDDPVSNTIKISSRDVFTVADTASGAVYNVRSLLEARAFNAPSNPADKVFFSLVKVENAPGSVENVVNRRILVPFADNTTPAYNKIVLDHVADLKKNASGAVIGLNIKAEDLSTAFPKPADFTAVLTNKQYLLTGTQNIDPSRDGISSANKLLRTYNNFTPNNNKILPVAPVSATTIQQLRTDASMVAQQRMMPDEGYKYTVTPVDFPEAGADPTKSIDKLPYYALTAVGLRYETGEPFVAPNTSPANNRRQDFNTAQGTTIPIATSVEIDLNGASSWAVPDSYALVTRYFGFNRLLSGADDATTVDRSFYQPADLTLRSTLDARVLDFPNNPPSGEGISSFVLQRAAATNATAAPAFALLPDYRLRALKCEYTNLNSKAIKPVADAIEINAFVYAQEGSWLIIPGDYFRSNPAVRGIGGAAGLTGSYIDYNGNKIADANEFIYDGVGGGLGNMVADLNRNGIADKGEKEAALRFVRYNMAPIRFLGAIVENQTAIVADVAAIAAGSAPIVTGAVQDWTDKWATYDDSAASNSDVGKPQLFSFISYVYDPSLANGTAGANQLRVPVTNDLIYQQ